jgi:putative ABC transport system permease protein
MLSFLFHRIKNNVLLYLFLLSGCILAVAIFSSIPMYSNGILQQVLTKSMENSQKESNEFPNMLYLKWKDENNKDTEIEAKLDATYNQNLFSTNLQQEVFVFKAIRTAAFRISAREGVLNKPRSRFAVIQGLDENITLERGTLPDNSSFYLGDRDYIEVLVTQEGLMNLDLLYNEPQGIEQNQQELFKIKVVGIVSKTENNALFWGYNEFNQLHYNVLISAEDLDFVNNSVDGLPVDEVTWRKYYEYEGIKSSQVSELWSLYENQIKWIGNNTTSLTLEYPFASIYDDFLQKEGTLKLTLWILTIPVLLMTSLYIYMISSLIMKNDGNEIALLKSRGAGTLQIFQMYVIQSLVISVIAYVVGPFLGIEICRFIGASNGFMEFISRDALPINLDSEARFYAFLAVVMFLFFTLIPALISSRVSIVQFKRSKNENKSKTIWEKAFIDVLLLIISGYGYYTLIGNNQVLGLNISQGNRIDPMLFVVSTCFIVGINLFALRVYPYIIRGIYFVFKRYLSPVLYFSLLNVGRADHNLRFIMLFIMLSISFGILGSSQARTLNQNAIDAIGYTQGSDIVVKPYEEESDEETPSIYADLVSEGQASSTFKVIVEDKIPYEAYQSLTTIDSVTKVYNNKEVVLRYGRETIQGVQLMGVIPHEFAKVTWYRNDLLYYHLNEYLNVLTQHKTALFLSDNLRESYKINPGEEITLLIDNEAVSAILYGYIPYFPTYESTKMTTDRGEAKEPNYFALMNYTYVQEKIIQKNYDLWMQKKVGVTDQLVQDELVDKGLEVSRVSYMTQELIKTKNDPILQGTNGVLTMCFLITMFITIIGYLLFWIISMKNRALTFGIFRAMGMTMNQVTRIIVTEQILMTGSAIIIGLLLGIQSSQLFVPLLKFVYARNLSGPPFIVVLLQEDYMRILYIVSAMLLFGLAVLFVIIRRLKMNQVIKLGED